MNFEKNGNYCFYNNIEEKMCYPAKCNDIYPKSQGWTLYGLSWCPYNKKANALLTANNISYYYYDIEKAPFQDKENFKKMMSKYLNGHKTTPAVFKDGKLIGGATELEAYLRKM